MNQKSCLTLIFKYNINYNDHNIHMAQRLNLLLAGPLVIISRRHISLEFTIRAIYILRLISINILSSLFEWHLC